MIITPRDVEPLFYVQAEKLIGLASGALIDPWGDSSGRGRIGAGMAAIGAGYKPTYVDSIPTYGGPAVQFIVPGLGDPDVLATPSFEHGIGAGALTAWVLIRPVNDSQTKSIWTFATGVHLGLGIKDLKPYFTGSNISGGAGQVGTTAMTASAWHVMILTRTGAGLLLCYVDGVADATTPTDTGTIPTGAIFLGGGTQPSINAEIRDFGMVGRLLTAAELEDLTVYLLNRVALPAPSIPRTLNWKVLCDWDANGNFTGTYDDISSRIDILAGLSSTRGRDPSRALGEPRIPNLKAVGVNHDRFYSTDWPGSPIYQKPIAARPFQNIALVGSTWDANSAELVGNAPVYANGSEEIPTFTGLLDRAKQRPAYEERRVDLTALGNLIKLRDRTTVSTGYNANLTTGTAWVLLMQALGIAADRYVVSGTAVVLLHWWLDRADPFSAAMELLLTEGPGAALYEDADGRYIFEGQTYRTTAARSLTPQAKFRPTGVGGWMFVAPQHEDGADAIINVASYHIRERQALAVQRVWSYSPSVTLSPSTTRFFNFYTDDPITGLVTTLLAGTDYVLGSGTLTQATVVQQNANLCVVTLTAGAGGAVINAATLQVRASPIAVLNEYDVANSVVQVDSIASFGTKARAFTGRSEIDPNVGISICDTAVQRYSQPRAVNRFGLVGKTGIEIQQALTLQISDRIAYREDQTGQDADAWIESLDFRAVDGLLVAVIGAERTIAQGYGRYDSGVYDTAVYGQ